MLPAWLIVIILGIIEGLTEFIPVSSTGHLLIAENLLGDHKSDLFNVVIQVGAVMAVLPLFRERIALMMRWNDPAGRDLALKVFVAFFITGVGGLILKKLGLKLPDELFPIAIALIAGGFFFLFIEGRIKGKPRTDSITWIIVLAVAMGQLVAAAFPGASRSGSTIMFAMALGLGRVPATEFSFLVGIPTMLAAGALEIREGLKAGEHEPFWMIALGFIVAAIVSFIAVKWLLRHVQSHTFVGFGIYRIIFGILLLVFSFLSR